LKFKDGSIPKLGEDLNQETLKMIDCLGTVVKTTDVCNSKIRDPRAYPGSGYSYQAQQPPLGYLPLVAVSDKTIDPTSLIIKLRSSQIFWFGLTFLIVLVISFTQKFGLLQFLSFATLSLTTPVFINSLGTVTNDAAGPFLGGLFLYFVILDSSKRLRKAPLILIGALFGLTKLLYLFLPLSSLLFYLFIEQQKSANLLKTKGRSSTFDVRENKKSTSSLVVLASGAIVSLVFYLFQFLRKNENSDNVLEALLGFSKTSNPSISTILQGINQCFQLVNSYIPSIWFSSLSIIVIAILGWALSKNEKHQFEASAIYILGAVVTASIGHIGTYVSGQYNFSSPARYMLPFLLLLSFAVCHVHKIFQIMIIVLATCGNFIWLMNPI
jgi:hypothetical protein